MKIGGNNRLWSYFEYYGLNNRPITEKFRTVAAAAYRSQLEEQLHGKMVTSSPPLAVGVQVAKQNIDFNTRYECFGSDDMHTHSKSAETKTSKEKSKPFYHKMGKAIAKSIQGIMGGKTSKGLRSPKDTQPPSNIRADPFPAPFKTTENQKEVAGYFQTENNREIDLFHNRNTSIVVPNFPTDHKKPFTAGPPVVQEDRRDRPITFRPPCDFDDSPTKP
jgi:hypothetical protein